MRWYSDLMLELISFVKGPSKKRRDQNIFIFTKFPRPPIVPKCNKTVYRATVTAAYDDGT